VAPKIRGTRLCRLPRGPLAFYGPDNRKATKAVLGIIETEEAEPRLHTWGGETADKDLRYDVSLQNDCVRIVQREGIPNNGQARSRLAALKVRDS